MPLKRSNIDEFNRTLQRATRVGLLRATIQAYALCRAAVNVPNTGQTRKRVKDTTARGGGPKGSQYTVYERPSRPGEPPHKITGTGQSNIVYEANDNAKNPATRLGVRQGGKHMIYLELGTQNIEPRPWLVATIIQNARQLSQLAITGARGTR
jgi:hypothetical protein